MMLTRCPACQTVFRLHPEQIRARNGEVRCGHCFNPFNALQHRIATTDEAEPAARGREQAAAATHGEPTPVVAAHAPGAGRNTQELDFELPEFPPFDDDRAAPEPPGQAERAYPTTDYPEAPDWGDRTVEQPQAFDAAESGAASSLPDVIRSGRRNPSPTETFAAARGHTAPEPDERADAAAARVTTEPEPKRELEPEAEQGHDQGHDQGRASISPADADEEALATATPQARHVDLEHLDATYGRPASKRSAVARTLTGMAAGLLAGTLAAQATYLFRTEIGRSLPGTRPLLEAGCAALGCDVPLPKDVALIAIETSDLQSDPARTGRYTLFTTVKNRADYPQAWPHLELTLTDGTDTPVVRRVFAPADWMPADAPKASLPARTTVPVRLPFRLEGASPTGYRVYVFYP
ncbi:DUF3426 domain-containing protein [Thauera sp. 2A1]|uniref:DUF3426 domain-containing protein n=1 Tax=Thauera sp. 2A1 TaxID=2570191 RepID=UPI001291BD42|nr:DUF3426 domain-containing protein [Thauera sp. 2A1]KAI5916304.1 zinc-ribbon domain-containing protein [Thauera sp. 2A1]